MYPGRFSNRQSAYHRQALTPIPRPQNQAPSDEPNREVELPLMRERPRRSRQPSIGRSPIPFHPRRLAKAHPANANGTDASVKMNGSIMPT